MARNHVLNLHHTDNPEVGDYWEEMIVPIARVVAVTPRGILVQKLGGLYGGKEISDTEPRPEFMTRAEFAAWLRYSSIPNKTWADVHPRQFP